jgi:hypothetical protein
MSAKTKAEAVPNARAFAFRDEMRATLLGALSHGSTYRSACGAAGIAWSTWMDWSRKVRAGTCDDPDVEALVIDARKAFEAANVALATSIHVATADDWKAAAWLLQHRQGDPKARHDEKRARYEAEVAKNRAAGTHVENVRNVSDLTDDEIRAEAKRLLGVDLDDDKPRTAH